MKRITQKLLLALMLTLSLTTTAYAAVTTLWSASSTTYVKSEHGDSYFSDTYNGTASVRGKDRGSKDGRSIYYKWTKITYDVQGSLSAATATSGGKNDSKQIIRKVTAKDKWNTGPKTKALYNYAYGIDGGNTARSLENIETFYGGGVFVLE